MILGPNAMIFEVSSYSSTGVYTKSVEDCLGLRDLEAFIGNGGCTGLADDRGRIVGTGLGP